MFLRRKVDVCLYFPLLKVFLPSTVETVCLLCTSFTCRKYKGISHRFRFKGCRTRLSFCSLQVCIGIFTQVGTASHSVRTESSNTGIFRGVRRGSPPTLLNRGESFLVILNGNPETSVYWGSADRCKSRFVNYFLDYGGICKVGVSETSFTTFIEFPSVVDFTSEFRGATRKTQRLLLDPIPPSRDPWWT